MILHKGINSNAFSHLYENQHIFFFPLTCHSMIQLDFRGNHFLKLFIWSVLANNDWIHGYTAWCTGSCFVKIVLSITSVLVMKDIKMNSHYSGRVSFYNLCILSVTKETYTAYYTLLNVLIDRFSQNICLMTLTMITFYLIIKNDEWSTNRFKESINLVILESIS
jgi:hypothetical protein